MCTVLHAISSNIDEVLSINPSANVFIFGDFNIRHKDWLTFSIRVSDCESLVPGLYYLFISSDVRICFSVAFLPLRNSDLAIGSVSIDCLSNSKGMLFFITKLMTILVS